MRVRHAACIRAKMRDARGGSLWMVTRMLPERPGPPILLLTVASCVAALLPKPGAAEVTTRPSFVFILADDLGYGDVRALNAGGKIATPSMDRLAAEGMVFTDAHSSASVCTPTRYSLLTGRYGWRSRLQSRVLGGVSPHLIDPGRLTLPVLLKRQGYTTACIGKWHLGMDWVAKPGTAMPFGDRSRAAEAWQVDYTKPIADGPTSVGFDYFYGIAGSLNMPPFTFIENDRVTALPTIRKPWSHEGPVAANFEPVDVLPAIVRKAVDYLDAQAHTNQPFFLYLPLTAPHAPVVPAPAWQGKSGINAYADFVMETDWAVGEVLRALDRDGLVDDTLVIVASDNGVSPAAKLPELAAHGHDSSYVFRGRKSDIWDGGHHVPFLVRWPGKVLPASSSDELIGLGDLLATYADILGVEMPADSAEDSVSILPALLARAHAPLHDAIVHHSSTGRFAIRQGVWKLELCPGSGGASDPTDPAATRMGLPPLQLYDMVADVGERTDVAAEHPDVVDRLTRLLERYVADGRSTPGALQHNDVPVDIRKDDANVRLQGDRDAD
jgi:arylsulfatase A